MARYQVGQLVHHRRYDYRGVIASADPFCLAPDKWYRRNTTQPARDQPWYHILVDGGQDTYVAEENLELTEIVQEIEHPYISRVFSMYLNGRYYRICPN